MSILRSGILALLLLVTAAAPVLADSAVQLTTELANDTMPAWSPDGSKIAFSSNRSGNWDIWVMPVTGGSATQITTNAKEDEHPDWSSDGNWIAFDSKRNINYDIFVVPATGGTQTQITFSGADRNRRPAWSPNDSLIAFDSDAGTEDIWVVPPTGGTPVQITMDPALDSDPDWSPDGSQFVFRSMRNGVNELFTMPSGGGTPTLLTSIPGYDPAWSNGGDRIAFSSAYQGTAFDVWVMPANGGRATKITDGPGVDGIVTWSPDDRKMAFVSDRAGNRDIWVIDVLAVDLAVTKSVDNPVPAEGDTVSFSVVLDNAGPDDATNVEVSDLLPSGLTFVSAGATAGSYDSGTGIWSVASLAAAGADTLTITATVDFGTTGQTFTNTATVTAADEPETDGSDDTASVDIMVGGTAIDLAVTKTVDDPNPAEGGTVVYTVVLANGGSEVATGVELTDVLPAGVTYVSDSTTQGSYTPGTGVWALASLGVAAADTLTITAVVDSGTTGQLITNTATVTASDQTDPNAANDSDSADITVEGVDLAVAKTVDDAAPNEGGTIVYTVALTNNGPDVATGVELTDLLPGGVTYVSDAATQGAYTPGTGVWTIVSLGAAASDTLTITATVDPGTAGQLITNTAAVTAVDQADTNPTNDADSVDVTVQAIDLAVTKTVDDPTPNEGGTIVYTVTVANNGPDTATGIQLTDLLPIGVTYVSDLATQGIYTPGTGVWAIDSLAAGESDTLTTTATVDPGTAGQLITNTVTVTAVDQADTNPANDADSVDVTVQAIDLAVTKTVDDPTPNEGGTIVYTVTVANNGPDTATGIQLTDLLPIGVTYVSDSVTQGTYTPGTGLWAIDSLAAGESDTLMTTATVDPGTAGQLITNTVTVTSVDQADTAPANDSDFANIIVQAIDLAVAKAVDDPVPNEGGTVTYTVALTNNGPDVATGVELTDVLPVGVTYVSDSVTQGTYTPGTGVWGIVSLGAAASDTLTITATVDPGTAGQLITNAAAVTASDQADVNPANDSDTADITVQAIDLAVTKTVDDPVPNEGDTVVYTVVLANDGAVTATGVELTDLLPTGVTFVSDSATQGTYTPGTGVWTLTSLATAASDTLTITATVDSATAGQLITNTATVSASDQTDTNPANDSDFAEITVQAIDLAVTKTVDDPTPDEGGAIIYTIALDNAGPDTATGVELTDVLPAGVTFASATATQGSYDSGTGVWTVGSVAAATPDTLQITATVDPGTAGQLITNTATVTAADQADTNPANDSDSTGVTVQAIDLAVTKTVDNPSPNEGEAIVYTVVLANDGAGTATGVELTDLLPIGVTWVSYTATQGTYTPGTGIWAIASLAGNASDTLTITATVDSATAGQLITNTATVTAVDQTDPNPANDSDSADITVPAIDLAVTKIVDEPAPAEGDSVVYTVTLTNLGPDIATGVELTDLLPAGLTYLSDLPTKGTYTPGTGLWALAALAADSSETLTITAAVDSGTVGQLITNTALVTASDQVDVAAANDSASVTIDVQAGPPVPVLVVRDLPNAFALETARPNPSRAEATIRFDVPVAGPVALAVYDVTGRRVATLVQRSVEPGRHAAVWDGHDDSGRCVAAGVYFVRLDTGSFTATRRIVRLR